MFHHQFTYGLTVWRICRALTRMLTCYTSFFFFFQIQDYTLTIELATPPIQTMVEKLMFNLLWHRNKHLYAKRFKWMICHCWIYVVQNCILQLHFSLTQQSKKSLKLPKGLSKSVNRRTVKTSCPKEKGQTTIYKTLHTKLKIKEQEPH